MVGWPDVSSAIEDAKVVDTVADSLA